MMKRMARVGSFGVDGVRDVLSQDFAWHKPVGNGQQLQKVGLVTFVLLVHPPNSRRSLPRYIRYRTASLS